MAVAAVQTVFLLDLVGCSRLNAPLRTVFGTAAAAHAGVRNLITFFYDVPGADGIALPENRMDAEVKIFHFSVPNLKYNAGQLSGIARIHVGQVGLLCKYGVDPFLLVCLSRIISLYFV